MAHAAIAYAKANNRRRMMACTTSIGPGATNMVTAAALAHVNRLPVLLLPGDVFASRRPDPVLQQVEDFGDPTVTANDCFRPVSRYWDRITRPEQLLRLAAAGDLGADRSGRLRAGDARAAAGRAGRGLRLPGILLRGARARDRATATRPRARWTKRCAVIKAARRPLIIAGGGVHYSEASEPSRSSPRGTASRWRRRRRARARSHSTTPAMPAPSASPARARPTGCSREADLVLAVGTRLQDFTTGSGALFATATIV